MKSVHFLEKKFSMTKKKGCQNFFRELKELLKIFFLKYIFKNFFCPPNICDPNFCPPNIYDKSTPLTNSTVFIYFLLWPRRCHCTHQPLVYGCSPHSPA